MDTKGMKKRWLELTVAAAAVGSVLTFLLHLSCESSSELRIAVDTADVYQYISTTARGPTTNFSGCLILLLLLTKNQKSKCFS